MTYLIKDISNYPADQHPYYFFDSNAWISQLKNTGNKKLDSHEKAYCDLFETIIALHSHKGTKQEKKVKHFPKIVVTSMLLSEIINAYMRNVAMKVFYKSQGQDHRNHKYKEQYRQENDHGIQQARLISDFIAFKDYVELRDDYFNAIDPYTILPNLASTMDFNDFYYYYQFYGSGIPIVTHDHDFVFQDIEIITAQTELLKLVGPPQATSFFRGR
jgi:hypothetical protein